MIALLMMSTKVFTPDLLKVKSFLNKSYDAIFSVHEVTNKILLYDLNYIVHVAMWPKFSNCSIFMRELQFCKDLARKTDFFEGWSWIKFNHLRLVLERVLKFYDNVVKVLELKVRTFWGLIPTFGEVAEEKLIGGGAPAILNRVTESSIALRNIPETSAWFDSFIPSESRSFNKIFFCFPDSWYFRIFSKVFFWCTLRFWKLLISIYIILYL